MSIRENIKEVLISEEQIRNRCKELGEEITRDYGEAGVTPLVIGLLRGSVPFLSELIKYIDLDLQYDFMDVTSYEGTKSTGDIKILKDLDTSVVGKHILIVEDIVDTGRTLTAVVDLFKKREAADVKIVSLLNKPSRRVMRIEPDYNGFDIEDYFVVGYGLDFNQHYRGLPYVGILNDDQY